MLSLSKSARKIINVGKQLDLSLRVGFQEQKSRSLVRCLAVSSPTQKQKFLVINSVGIDRTGIVSDLTKVIIDAGGNVGESRAVKLGHHFSMMLLASVPESQCYAVKLRLNQMKELHITALETTDPSEFEVAPKIGCKRRHSFAFIIKS